MAGAPRADALLHANLPRPTDPAAVRSIRGAFVAPGEPSVWRRWHQFLCAWLLLVGGAVALTAAPAPAQPSVTALDGILHVIWADPHPELGGDGAISYV